MATSDQVRVTLERGSTWTFASALDWPGWSRRGRGDEAALDALETYADRYATVAAAAGPRRVGRFAPGALAVVSSVRGDAGTDFGAPSVAAPQESDPLPAREATRFGALLSACWEAFDAAVARSSPTLTKGPRGGGRDRDAIVDHVQEAERAYGRSLGIRVPPRTPWPEQRAVLLEALSAGVTDSTRWTWRYGVRRIAWHVLDHAWEIEDKQP